MVKGYIFHLQCGHGNDSGLWSLFNVRTFLFSCAYRYVNNIGKKTKTIPKSCSKTRTKDKTHRNYETNTKTKVRSVVSSLCSDPLSSSRNWHRQHFRDHPDFQHNGLVWYKSDTASISCSPESTTSPAELTKRFGQTMKHAGFLLYIIWDLEHSLHI